MDSLPESIIQRIAGKTFRRNEVGLSGAEVMVFEDCVLKIMPVQKKNDETVEVMRWLAGRLPVPRVLCYERDAARQYLLMRRVTGKMACDPWYMERPKVLVPILAEALNMLWQVDPAGCPRHRTPEAELQEARRRVETGLTDPGNADPATFWPGGFRDPEDLLNWLEHHRPPYEPVLSHGDFCLPNLLLENGRLSGFIDLGDRGIGDKWRDIALCWRSLKWNAEGAYGGKVCPDLHPDMLFDALGIAPDREKLRYYLLMDELY